MMTLGQSDLSVVPGVSTLSATYPSHPILVRSTTSKMLMLMSLKIKNPVHKERAILRRNRYLNLLKSECRVAYFVIRSLVDGLSSGKHSHLLKVAATNNDRLAYQSTGVIYGDIGTSPLYVYSSTFSSAPSYDDLLGALSLIIWSLALIVCVKYVFIVLRADDEGEGGTFAVYSLLSRYVS